MTDSKEFKKNLEFHAPLVFDDIVKKMERYEYRIEEYKRKLKLVQAERCPDPAAHRVVVAKQDENNSDRAVTNRRADKLFKIGLVGEILLVLGLAAVYFFAMNR